MIFQPLKLDGAVLIKPEPHTDERGFFARTFCEKEFKSKNLISSYVQQSISYNKTKGTLRGLHFQAIPYQEVKLVQCIKGSIFDVIVDIRINSPTFGQWFSTTLSEHNELTLYIPGGFAHGFQTLEDNSKVHYQMSNYYNPKYSRTINWRHPDININWPEPPSLISENDNNAKFNPLTEYLRE